MVDRVKEFLSNFSSVTVGNVGVGWVPTVAERTRAKELLIFLADRRALDPTYLNRDLESLQYVTDSILKVRGRINFDLQKVKAGSRLARSLIVMQHECVMYLDRIESFERNHPQAMSWRSNRTWARDTVLALRQIQRASALEMAGIIKDYNIDDAPEKIIDILYLTNQYSPPDY
jgi:hypothetical protein